MLCRAPLLQHNSNPKVSKVTHPTTFCASSRHNAGAERRTEKVDGGHHLAQRVYRVRGQLAQPANMEKVLEEIPGEHHLRHVDSNDKSKPVIDPGGHS
jgi:hypothetical protein